MQYFRLKIAFEVKAGTPWRGEAFLAPFAADIPTKPRFPKVVKPQMRQNR